MQKLFGKINLSGIDKSQFQKYDDRYCFMGAGRVDNRNELKQMLAVPEVSDVDLLWFSFLKWQHNAVKHILGDWSFAVYDTQEKELFLARDHHGYTAVYYTQIADEFYFSSSISTLLKLKTPQINEKRLVSNITIWFSVQESNTAFKNIHSLEAGHTLLYKNGKVSVTQFWFPENIPLRNYKNHDDYSEELFEIFKEAVACRLVGSKPVASMLSGGLDSGSVASMAALILQKENKSLTTFSHVPQFKSEAIGKGKNTFYDETDHILATAGFYPNINPVLLNSAAISPLSGLRTFLKVNEEMIHGACNASWMVDIYQSAADAGFGAILTGENGNGALSNAGLQYLLPWSHPSFRHNPKSFLKELVRPLYNKLKPASKDFESYLGGSFLNPNIMDDYQILEDVRKNDSGFGAKNYQNANEAMSHLLTLARSGRCTNGGNASNYFGIEKRDPTADMRVLEYCLSIPNEAFINDKGVNRHVVRKMMAGTMSPKTLNERKTGRQSADIMHRVLAHPAEMNETLSQLSNNAYFCYLFNIKSMMKYWQYIQEKKADEKEYNVNSLLKAIMAGYFLERNRF